MPKILAFSGSARRGSFNQRLAEIAAEVARRAGAEVTTLNLADYPLPLFNYDLEQASGMPAAAREFKACLAAHAGWLIASPEYNSAYSALLKNALDWASRAERDDEVPLSAFRNTSAAIMAASPSPLGGLRGLVALRMLLGNLGVLVLPQQVVVKNAASGFDAAGLSDARQANTLEKLVGDLVELSG